MLCDLGKVGHHSGPLRFLTSSYSSVNIPEEKEMAMGDRTASVQCLREPAGAAGVKSRRQGSMVTAHTHTHTPCRSSPASRGQP